MEQGLGGERATTARCLEEDAGVTSIEYALLGMLIAVACIVAFQALGTSIAAVFAAWSAAVLGAL